MPLQAALEEDIHHLMKAWQQHIEACHVRRCSSVDLMYETIRARVCLCVCVCHQRLNQRHGPTPMLMLSM